MQKLGDDMDPQRRLGDDRGRAVSRCVEGEAAEAGTHDFAVNRTSEVSDRVGDCSEGDGRPASKPKASCLSCLFHPDRCCQRTGAGADGARYLPVYLIGSARSGTTWLQRMLGSHPEIATPQETDLFSRYLAGWRAAWAEQLPESAEEWRRKRHKGLPAVFTVDEFDDCLREVVERVYRSVLACKPSARVVLEKDPEYSHHVAAIVDLVPRARFIHLVRDGRDVAASMLRSSSGWGHWWAPKRIGDASQRWRGYVEGAQQAACAPGGYLELRYEDLRSPSAGACLREAFAFCEVEVTDELTRGLLDRYQVGRPTNATGGIVWRGEVQARLQGEPPEPDGFVREGLVGTWQTRLSTSEWRLFDEIAGELLGELGYEDNPNWAQPAEPTATRAAARVSRTVLSGAQSHTKALPAGATVHISSGAARGEATRPPITN